MDETAQPERCAEVQIDKIVMAMECHSQKRVAFLWDRCERFERLANIAYRDGLDFGTGVE